MKLKQTQTIILIVFILLGLAIMVTSILPKSTHYYVTVDELLLDLNKYQNREIKVAGQVLPKSIVKNDQTMTWNFKVQNNDKVIDVTYTGAMPDTFKDEAQVVVSGSLLSSNQFQASHVLAKCASRYEEKLQPGLNTKTIQ